MDEPLGGPLVLRHASRSISRTWEPDDWDVVNADGRDIGRISKAGAGVPYDRPWMWTITGALVQPLPSYGFCATLDEAKAKFAATWRARLALSREIFSSSLAMDSWG